MEPTLTLIVLCILSVSFHFPSPAYEYFVLTFIIVLFSVQYGLYIALFTFLEAILASLFIGMQRGDDILLYFFSAAQWMSWGFLLLVGAYIGLMTTSGKERYEDIHMVNRELTRENEQFKRTIDQLNETRMTLKSRVLESNHHFDTMFHMFKALNHTHPELVLNEATHILKQYFGANKIAIYTVDDRLQSLRLKLRSDQNSETFLQSIFVEKASPVIKQTLAENKPCYRTRNDTKYAPTLIGPITVNGKIQYVVFLDEIDFVKVTSQQFELFTWFLRLVGDRLDYASELWLADQANRVFPGTNIYYEVEFEHLLHIEKERFEELGFPYSYFELSIPRHSLVQINATLQKQLREIDMVGYDANRQTLLVLLPGTEEQNLPLVKDRMKHALIREGVLQP